MLSKINSIGRSILEAIWTSSKSAPNWSFEIDLSPWENSVNSSEAELLSGVHLKISQVRNQGFTQVIGGLTTGGEDYIYTLAPSEAISYLLEVMKNLDKESFLFLYIPHPFWAPLLKTHYNWLPKWEDVYQLLEKAPEWSIFQYSTSFDAAGRYFIVGQKKSVKRLLPAEFNLSDLVFHVFFHPGGADLNQGNSSKALSAHLCHALTKVGAKVHSYSYKDTDMVSQATTNDILIGHVGPWVPAAYKNGLSRVILFNPVNRWYPTRDRPDIEADATIEEQVGISKMVIAQSGAIWRLSETYPSMDKWRWIDLGIDQVVFPRIKTSFNLPGNRKFCFIHLHDSVQKGNDIAKGIIDARPNYKFIWIGGERVSRKNVRFHNFIPNTTSNFQKTVAECDFLLAPSKEDAQPGTPIEAAALGLIPVMSYTSGYSISYPKIVSPNTIEEWVKVVDFLQNVSSEDLSRCQGSITYYLNQIHNWNSIEDQIILYIREFLRDEDTGL